MIITKGTGQHYPELIEIWEASVRATHHFLPEENILTLKPLILEHYFDAVELRCAFLEEQLVGFIGVANENIEMLFIHPNWFRQGVGRALIQYALDNLSASKVDVNEQNPNAIAFYERLGFKRVGRSECDGQGEPFPLIHMTLDV